MDENQPIWANWKRTLKHIGISEGVASLIEMVGSLNVLVAQALYLSQPLLSGAVSPGSLQKLAHMLESPSDRRLFIAFLREAPPSGTGA